SALEARELSPIAVVILSAIVIAPAHGLTQGFQWPTIVFYLLVDSMLAVMAYLTRSILPGIVVHCFGLLVFFSLIWPNDAHRNLDHDTWFWIHAIQAVVFAALSIFSFVRLARP